MEATTLKMTELSPAAVATLRLITPDFLDIYLPRGVKSLEVFGIDPVTLTRFFTRRDGALFFGLPEFLTGWLSVSAQLSGLTPRQVAQRVVVHAVPEGTALYRHETALTMVGPEQLTMCQETLLWLLSHGTCFRTAIEPYRYEPWLYFGARYQGPLDSALFHRAIVSIGRSGSVPAYDPNAKGTESHSLITTCAAVKLGRTATAIFNRQFGSAVPSLEEIVESAALAVASLASAEVLEGLKATIRATIAFATAHPQVPTVVLADYVASSIGVAKTVIATAQAFAALERATNGQVKLFGFRGDISKGTLNDEPIYDAGLPAELRVPANAGMSVMATRCIAAALKRAGLSHLAFVVSSGIHPEAIRSYVEAGATMAGIGEEFAKFDKEFNFTSDASGYFDEAGHLVPRAKEGRELIRVVDRDILAAAERHVNINLGRMERVDLEPYVRLLEGVE